jgi:hypothetical protein
MSDFTWIPNRPSGTWLRMDSDTRFYSASEGLTAFTRTPLEISSPDRGRTIGTRTAVEAPYTLVLRHPHLGV